jgi:SAM-dependent methyltransferase
MANFAPLKQYMLYCLDRFVERYDLHGPFLEIGCGRGDVSAHLAGKGWTGTAIDFSDSAIAEAATALAPFPNVVVKQQDLGEVTGEYPCIILWDVLEHIADDLDALRAIGKRLVPGGQLLVAVPSNPREWRWDDDFYGHFRRYTVAELTRKLIDAGLEPQVFWDFTYPVFWAMRRTYTRLKPAPPISDKSVATRASANKGRRNAISPSRPSKIAVAAMASAESVGMGWAAEAEANTIAPVVQSKVSELAPVMGGERPGPA